LNKDSDESSGGASLPDGKFSTKTNLWRNVTATLEVTVTLRGKFPLDILPPPRIISPNKNAQRQVVVQRFREPLGLGTAKNMPTRPTCEVVRQKTKSTLPIALAG